jgi:hypothetical protein
MFAAPDPAGKMTMSTLAAFTLSRELLTVKGAGDETVSVAPVPTVTLPVTSTLPLFIVHVAPAGTLRLLKTWLPVSVVEQVSAAALPAPTASTLAKIDKRHESCLIINLLRLIRQ